MRELKIVTGTANVDLAKLIASCNQVPLVRALTSGRLIRLTCAPLLGEAIREAPVLGIEVLAVTIFASNQASIRLFERHGFSRWGYMPRVARLGAIERDLVMMRRRLAE